MYTGIVLAVLAFFSGVLFVRQLLKLGKPQFSHDADCRMLFPYRYCSGDEIVVTQRISGIHGTTLTGGQKRIAREIIHGCDSKIWWVKLRGSEDLFPAACFRPVKNHF